jgi:cytoskeleton protein RodZ
MAAGMRVGSELKAARKKAGISVDVISKRTKVKASTLVALENADFKNLPTGLYLFSMIRAYAREVHINPEPIVERLRAEFSEKDTLDALHALDATGALQAKSLANARRSTEGRSYLFRNVTVGVVLIAAAGAGAYLYGMGNILRSSHIPAVNALETPSFPLSSPAPAATAATAIDPPQQSVGAIRTPTSTKTRGPKRRTAALTQPSQETGATDSTVSDALRSSPAQTEEPADKPANVLEFTPAP